METEEVQTDAVLFSLLSGEFFLLPRLTSGLNAAFKDSQTKEQQTAGGHVWFYRAEYLLQRPDTK